MRRILIIDDEEKLRNLLTRIISLEGFEVLQAGDCKTALKKLEQNDVDVVLCDVKLPDGNGVEFSKKIKDKFPHIEIILLTAYGNIPDSVQAIKNGALRSVFFGIKTGLNATDSAASARASAPVPSAGVPVVSGTARRGLPALSSTFQRRSR